MSFAVKMFALLVVAVFITEGSSKAVDSEPAVKKEDTPSVKATEEQEASKDEEGTGIVDGNRRCLLINCHKKCPPGEKEDKNGKCRKVSGK